MVKIIQAKWNPEERIEEKGVRTRKFEAAITCCRHPAGRSV
jgi:hypothetical protein